MTFWKSNNSNCLFYNNKHRYQVFTLLIFKFLKWFLVLRLLVLTPFMVLFLPEVLGKSTPYNLYLTKWWFLKLSKFLQPLCLLQQSFLRTLKGLRSCLLLHFMNSVTFRTLGTFHIDPLVEISSILTHLAILEEIALNF